MKPRSFVILTPRFASVLTIVLASAFTALKAHAQESALPFPVSVGGQAATVKAGEPFARIDKPVTASATIEVGAKADMVIINVTPYDVSKKAPVPGTAPAVILLQGTQKGTLDKTMDNQKLKPGNYLMSVMADSKTDSVLLQVE